MSKHKGPKNSPHVSNNPNVVFLVSPWEEDVTKAEIYKVEYTKPPKPPEVRPPPTISIADEEEKRIIRKEFLNKGVQVANMQNVFEKLIICGLVDLAVCFGRPAKEPSDKD